MTRLQSIKPKVKTLNTNRTVKPVERERGAEWRRQRDSVMLLDKGLCRQCRSEGRITAAREVDHIIPLADGGPDTIGNKQALCIECHRKKSKMEIRRRTSSSSEL